MQKREWAGGFLLPRCVFHVHCHGYSITYLPAGTAARGMVVLQSI